MGKDLSESQIKAGENAESRILGAVAEVFCVCVLGLMPLLLFAFVTSLTANGSLFFDKLAEQLSHGQLFLYVFSMTGGLLWLLLTQAKLYGKAFLALYGLWLIVPMLFSLIFYGKMPDFGVKVADFVIIISIVCYLLYVFLYFFLSSLYRT